MKKTLIAAALFAGFAGAAQAETQVTLYGIVDLGVGYQKIKNKGQSQSKLGMASGNQSGSRWGLRGTEDLGGGTSAVFTLESGFYANNGISAQSRRLFGRQATVGLTNDTWGQVDLGRQTNIASKYFDSIDPFGAGFANAAIGHGFGSAKAVSYNNMVAYQTPLYNGFQAAAGYSFNMSNSQQTGGFHTKDNARVITTGLRYLNGPLNLAASYDQINAASTAPAADRTKVRSYLVGGVFDFEFFKLSAALGQTRNGWIGGQELAMLNDNKSAGIEGFKSYASGFRSSTYMVGATVPLAATGNLFGSWQRMDPKNKLLTGDNQISDVYSLGYSYDLSKRTNLYAYGNYTTNYAFQKSVNGTTSFVGVRHRF